MDGKGKSRSREAIQQIISVTQVRENNLEYSNGQENKPNQTDLDYKRWDPQAVVTVSSWEYHVCFVPDILSANKHLATVSAR